MLVFSCYGEGGQSWTVREFETNRVETQMMKQREKGGDYTQPGCGTMVICIDVNSSGWSRILLTFFFALLIFLFR